MSDPFHSIAAKRDVPLFIFGDHVSRHIPPELNNLGLSGDDLTRHIAWDIGTDILVEYLCDHFGCAGQMAGISRLVIDLNRDPAMPSSIPEESDGTVIHGNCHLSPEDKQARIDTYHTPYHAALSEKLAAYSDPLVISMHSFTPRLTFGDERRIDIGLLVKHDEPSAEALHAQFTRLDPHLHVGINEPYSAHILNYTIDTAVASKGYRHLAIEVNQRHIDTEEKARDMAAIIADRLEPIVFGTFDPNTA